MAAFVAAFHLGEAATSLPLALSLREGQCEPWLAALIDCCLSHGGLREDQWLSGTVPATHYLAAKVAAAGDVLRSLFERGQLRGEDVLACLQRWRASRALQVTTGSSDEPWRGLWQSLAKLEAAARLPR